MLALAGSRAAIAGSASGHHKAVAVCRAAGDGAQREPVTVVEDGSGGSFVWLTDADANLWLCGADADGRVYVFDLIFDDLLRGAGVKLLPPVSVDRDGKPVLPPDPVALAQSACQAYLGDAGSTVLNSGADGLEGNWVPGYFVFLGTKTGETFLCNATSNARVWVFARVDAQASGSASVG